jgi:uncharacterized membrane protein YhaH (DUF805 family)
VAVPILVFVISLAAGAALTARWLPDLGNGRIPETAFWVTCGLAAVAFALVAVHVYEIVRLLNSASVGGIGNATPDIVASGITDTLRDAGPILGLAAVVYLLAQGLPTTHAASSYASKAE